MRDNGQLSLRPGPDSEIVVITPRPVNLTPADTSSQVEIKLAAAIRQRHPRVVEFRLSETADEIEIEIGVPILKRNLFECPFGADGCFGIVATGGIDEDAGGAEGFYNGALGFRQA